MIFFCQSGYKKRSFFYFSWDEAAGVHREAHRGPDLARSPPIEDPCPIANKAYHPKSQEHRGSGGTVAQNSIVTNLG